MRAPVRGIRGRWPASWERRFGRLFRVDPRVVLEEAPDPAAFRAAMSLVHVGDTIKITGENRHGAADALLLDHLDLDGATVVDVGVSDGSTAVELLARVPGIASYVMTDLYLVVDVVEMGSRVLFFEPEGRCVLAVGRRTVAWPGLSRTVRLLWSPWLRRARTMERRPILLLGPAARELVRTDPRVTVQMHDVFQPWPGVRPDVIKVANLLRRLYFSDEDILRGLSALCAGLDEGGHLLVVDNPRIPGIPVRAGLYRRHGTWFECVGETEHAPEIADLIAARSASPTRRALG